MVEVVKGVWKVGFKIVQTENALACALAIIDRLGVDINQDYSPLSLKITSLNLNLISLMPFSKELSNILVTRVRNFQRNKW